MPYYISDQTSCPAWAVVKEDGEVLACHDTQQSAIDQAVAVSLAEDTEYLGERSVRELPDNYRPALAEDVPEGRACGNCFFYDESRVSDDGTKAWCNRWDEFVEGDFYCNAWQADDEERQVNLTPPAYFRASARRGLRWVEEGRAGDGLLERTIREARAMAEGNVTADKWVRLRAFLARHMVDFDAPAANPSNEDYPSPGVVAVALWGGGGTRRSAQRALDYATSVVDRLNEENEGRTKGATLSKLETREFEFDLELREEGDEMSLTGYAALFNSRSENLGGFTEVIAPGAFSRSLKSRNDVKLLWNHDTSAVLGSTRAGTLTLIEDEKGLRVDAKLPNTTHGRDARELIKRGDVNGFSFGFSIPGKGGDTWNSEGTERTLKSVRLHEVSLTPFPAYTATNGTAAVRGLDKVATRAEVDADQLADALLKVEQGEEITSDERQLLGKVIDTLAPQAEPQTELVVDDGFLKLKKLKADLLMKGI